MTLSEEMKRGIPGERSLRSSEQAVDLLVEFHILLTLSALGQPWRAQALRPPPEKVPLSILSKTLRVSKLAAEEAFKYSLTLPPLHSLPERESTSKLQRRKSTSAIPPLRLSEALPN